MNEKNTLQEVQQYIKDVIEIRGFANQEIEKTMLLLLEEVWELAKAIRKTATNMGLDNNKINHYDTIESEVADVFIVLNSVFAYSSLSVSLLTLPFSFIALSFIMWYP